MGYQEVEEICRELGFLSEGYENNEEKILFVDLWAWLHGDINDGISRINLKILLAAIQGFQIETEKELKLEDHLFDKDKKEEESKYSSKSSTHSNHQTDRQNHFNHNYSDSRDTTKFICFEIGEFHNSTLTLTPKDIKRCQKYFILLSRNRSKHLKDRKKEQYLTRKATQPPTHTPKINTYSETLVKGLIHNLTENKIPHYELLLYKGKEYERNKEKLIRSKKVREIERSRQLSNRYHQKKKEVRKEVIVDYLEDMPLEDSGGVLGERDGDGEIEGELSGVSKEGSEGEKSGEKSEELLEPYTLGEETFSSKIQMLEEEKALTQKEYETERYPILFVDINLGNDQIERITIFEGIHPHSNL